VSRSPPARRHELQLPVRRGVQIRPGIRGTAAKRHRVSSCATRTGSLSRFGERVELRADSGLAVDQVKPIHGNGNTSSTSMSIAPISGGSSRRGRVVVRWRLVRPIG